MTDPRPVYQVDLTRDGEFWLADVPQLEGTHTFARSLEELDVMVREIIILGADLPDDAAHSFDVEYIRRDHQEHQS